MDSYEDLLTLWGWDRTWQTTLSESRAVGEPGRVIGIDRGSLSIRLADGPARGIWRPARKTLEVDSPAVGDWCVLEPPRGGPAIVHTILPRRSSLTRKASGRTSESQVLAANADTAILVCGLDRTQGVRSLERFVTLVLDGGVMPLVVLNKTDLCDDVDAQLQLARNAAPGFDVLPVSVKTGMGLADLRARLAPGSTSVLLGPSGAGKSSLVNALDGSCVAQTGVVRTSDRRGRHTSTRRQLHQLAGGALLVDTPGLRELAAWVQGDGLRQAFADIENLAAGCRFRNCGHDNEPGCNVCAALANGELEPSRFLKYLEIRKEAQSLSERRGNSKRRFKEISRFARSLKTEKHSR
jgi:ribosome biogenesis GTPase / thiamine phosphate phosphatase